VPSTSTRPPLRTSHLPTRPLLLFTIHHLLFPPPHTPPSRRDDRLVAGACREPLAVPPVPNTIPQDPVGVPPPPHQPGTARLRTRASQQATLPPNPHAYPPPTSEQATSQHAPFYYSPFTISAPHHRTAPRNRPGSLPGRPHPPPPFQRPPRRCRVSVTPRFEEISRIIDVIAGKLWPL
jgi:hypothetical protein